jgi:type IV pilus assembly protein PilM
MPFSFLNRQPKKRDQLIAVDLGGRTTKAIQLQRQNGSFTLVNYCLLDAPIFEKNLSVELLTEHLKNVVQALDAKTKLVTLAVGVGDSVVRTTEMPLIPVPDMRQILKLNAKTYMQQDMPGYVFDCAVIQSNRVPTQADKMKLGGDGKKQKVLVAGARKQLIDDLQTAVRNTGLIPDHIVPSVIGPVNAFELTMPQVFASEVIALVDIGFKNSTICILQQGELILSRVVALGGDRITSGLAESMNISYAEAEGIKVGMPHEVQNDLEMLVKPLGRELRASIDFFEHQQDKPVGRVFISGGSARSEFIVKTLESELLVPCETWNPLASIQLSLPPQQSAEVEHIASQLSVAIGAAAGSF